MPQTPEEKRAYGRARYAQNPEVRERQAARRRANPEKSREYTRRWREKNPEKVSADNKRFRELNPDYHREWEQKNREKVNATSRAWRAANPEKSRETLDRFRKSDKGRAAQAAAIARRQAKGPEWHWGRHLWDRHRMRPEEWSALWDAQGGCCYLCGEPMDITSVHIDHDHSHCGARRSCKACRRGLAHPACNHMIGFVGEDPARLRHAADALENAQQAAAERMALMPEQLHLDTG